MSDKLIERIIPDGEYTARLEEVANGKMIYRITRGVFADRFIYVPLPGEETLVVENITIANVRRKDHGRAD